MRWGFTLAELDAYMAALAGLLPYGTPPVCLKTGPIGTDDKTKIYKSALGEYWMWLGDAWRVVAGFYKESTTSLTSQTAVAGGSLISIVSMTPTLTRLADIEYQYQGTGASSSCSAGFELRLNGVNVRPHDDAYGTTTNLLRITGYRVIRNVPLVAGQTLELMAGTSGANYTKTRASINLEYK